MSSNLKKYFIWICLPATLATGWAFHSLVQVFSESNITKKSMRVMQLAESLRGDNSRVETNMISRVLNDFKELECIKGMTVESPGAFIWKPPAPVKRGMKQAKDVGGTNRVETATLVEHVGLSTAMTSELEKKTHWNDWTSEGANKTVKRPRRGVMTIGSCQVLWSRVNNPDYGSVVSGLVFDKSFLKEKSEAINNALNDVGDSVKGISGNVLSIAGTLVFLLLCSCSAGFWLIARDEAKARRDNAMKTSFISNCSHELRTPLAGIKLWLELLCDGRAELNRACELMTKENNRMIRLVENLLDYARLEKGRRKYTPELLDVSAIAADITDMMRENFAGHGIELRTDEKCLVLADPDAVKQILFNLLGNAAKYAAEQGPIEVEVSHDDKMCRISVSDRGPGIPKELRKRVFERFYRADDALNSKTNGLGLGLSISLALARDMGGNVSLTAREGGGCIFTLELPK